MWFLVLLLAIFDCGLCTTSLEFVDDDALYVSLGTLTGSASSSELPINLGLEVGIPDEINISGHSRAVVDVLVSYNVTHCIQLFGEDVHIRLQPVNLIDITYFNLDSVIHEDIKTVREYFAGTFSHKFDLHRYPYDSQTLDFKFKVVSRPQTPLGGSSSDLWTLQGGGYSELPLSGLQKSGMDLTYAKIVVDIDAATYDVMVTVEADRIYEALVVTVIFPTVLFVVVGWFTLSYDVAKFMPRVGQTMFSLLTITHYRTALSEDLPPHHYTPFLLHFMTVSLVQIALVLPVHAVDEKLDRLGRRPERVALDRICFVTYPLVYLFLVLYTVMEAYETLSPAANSATLAIVLASALFLSGSVYTRFAHYLRKLEASAVAGAGAAQAAEISSVSGLMKSFFLDLH